MLADAIPRRVAAVIAVAVLACLGCFALAIGAVRDRVDAGAAAESERLMAARLGDLRAALATVANEYNHWSDAHRAMAARDLPWIAENYAVTAISGTLFDGLVLLDGPIGAPLGWQKGGPSEPGPSFLPPDLLDRVRAEVARLPLGERATFDALAAVDGRLVLLSASRVQPLDGAEASRLDPASLAIAVVTNTFDATDAGAIVDALALRGLAFVPARGPSVGALPGSAALPLRGPGGEPLGALAWDPPRPGSVVARAMAPVLVAAALAFAALGALAILLARALLGRLVQGSVEAARLARTDSLTGLPNRLAFTEALAAPARAGERAVLFLDLNGFKRINDSMGHAVGDLVIRELASRLEALAGDGCRLARIGGDEFVAVLSGPGSDRRAAEFAQGVEAAMERPFEAQGHRLRLRTAIGYAVQAADDVPGDDLVRQADLAMYAAKREEAEAVAFDAMIGAAADDALAVERALRATLARRPGEIRVAYQPIVEARSGRLVRAEALARWTSPLLGSVPPARFIPVAEQAGLILPLGRQVLLQVCEDLARHPALRVSLNVSPLQLMAPAFVAEMAAELAARGIEPSRVEVELTESVVVDDPALAALRLRELHAAGFSTALDDFGTGYSSIGYLDQLSFDTVKIDRSFVSGQRASAERRALVSAMISLGHALGLRVVCEGVEQGADVESLTRLGCDLLQGFHLDRPLGIDDLAVRWLRAPAEHAVA